MIDRQILAVALGLTLPLGLALPSPVLADAAYPIDLVAAVEDRAGIAFVGRSGQLYAPAGSNLWRRATAGGIAVDVVAAVRDATSDALFAVGAEAPPFRFASGSWQLVLLANRGETALSTTGAPTLAVGRHIYLLDKGSWVRRASAARRVIAVWAASPTQILAATTDGALVRFNGRRFTPLRTGLPPSDPITILLGASPAQVFARTRAGVWLRIDRTAAVHLAIARELEGFEEQASGLAPDGTLLLAGQLAAAPDGSRRSLLAKSQANRVVPGEELQPLAAGDRFAVIRAVQGGDLLVATRSGAVRARSHAGAWTDGRVAADLPGTGAHRPGAGPARSR